MAGGGSGRRQYAHPAVQSISGCTHWALLSPARHHSWNFLGARFGPASTNAVRDGGTKRLGGRLRHAAAASGVASGAARNLGRTMARGTANVRSQQQQRAGDGSAAAATRAAGARGFGDLPGARDGEGVALGASSPAATALPPLAATLTSQTRQPSAFPHPTFHLPCCCRSGRPSTTRRCALRRRLLPPATLPRQPAPVHSVTPPSHLLRCFRSG